MKNCRNFLMRRDWQFQNSTYDKNILPFRTALTVQSCTVYHSGTADIEEAVAAENKVPSDMDTAVRRNLKQQKKWEKYSFRSSTLPCRVLTFNPI